MADNFFSFIKQPPDKYNYLVDSLNSTKTLGFTNNIEKIEYNLDLIGYDVKLKSEIESMLAVNSHMVIVVPIGKYLTIIELNKERTEGEMIFTAYLKGLDIDAYKKVLVEDYSEEIANQYAELYNLYDSFFSPEGDNVELLGLS